MARVLEFRITTALLLVGGFLAGLGGGLHAFHALLESDVDLDEFAARRADPEGLRAAHGDRLTVHGRVEEKRVESTRDASGMRLLYVVELADGTARATFAVKRTDYEALREGAWTRLPLVWDSTVGDYQPAPVKAAVQPWQYGAAYAAGAAFLAGGAVWRFARSGVVVRRDGDLVRVEKP